MNYSVCKKNFISNSETGWKPCPVLRAAYHATVSLGAPGPSFQQDCGWDPELDVFFPCHAHLVPVTKERPLCILPSCQTYPHREPSVRPRVFCGAAAYSVRDQLKPPISDLVSKGKPSPGTSYCPSHIASCSEAGIVTSFTPGDSGWLLERSFAFAWYSGRT